MPCGVRVGDGAGITAPKPRSTPPGRKGRGVPQLLVRFKPCGDAREERGEVCLWGAGSALRSSAPGSGGLFPGMLRVWGRGFHSSLPEQRWMFLGLPALLLLLQGVTRGLPAFEGASG